MTFEDDPRDADLFLGNDDFDYLEDDDGFADNDEI